MFLKMLNSLQSPNNCLLENSRMLQDCIDRTSESQILHLQFTTMTTEMA